MLRSQSLVRSTGSSGDKADSSALNAIALPAAIAAFSGSCTTGEWRAVMSGADTADGLTSVVASAAPWSGSVLLASIGFAGLVYLATRAIRPRGWLIVVLALLLDWLISALLLSNAHTTVGTNSLEFWPYLLGTVATFAAGIVIGSVLFFAPLRFAFGMVCLDFLIAGLIGFVQPQALSLRLVSRILAAVSAAAFGAIVGRNVFTALANDRSAMGRCVAATTLQIVIAGVGGIMTVFAMRYFGF